jgi:hypothetical protein
MALGLIQPLTEMSTGYLPGGKGRLVCKADNFTAIYESIVYKMWEPRHLTRLWVSMACYRDSFTIFWFYKRCGDSAHLIALHFIYLLCMSCLLIKFILVKAGFTVTLVVWPLVEAHLVHLFQDD